MSDLSSEDTIRPGRFPLPPRRSRLPRAAENSARDWRADWEWPGVPAQLHCEENRIRLWHVETLESLAARFPDLIEQAGALLPGTILEGRITAWGDERPHPHTSPDDSGPGARVFMATDCLAVRDVPIDTMPLYARLQQMVPIVGSLDLPGFRCSEELPLLHWGDLDSLRTRARNTGIPGIRLRRLDDTRPEAAEVVV